MECYSPNQERTVLDRDRRRARHNATRDEIVNLIRAMGRPVTMQEAAAVLDESPTYIGRVAGDCPRTFVVIQADSHAEPTTIRLHPHLCADPRKGV